MAINPIKGNGSSDSEAYLKLELTKLKNYVDDTMRRFITKAVTSTGKLLDAPQGISVNGVNVKLGDKKLPDEISNITMRVGNAEVALEPENIRFAVGKIGGENRIRNGGFTLGVDGWGVGGVASYSVNDIPSLSSNKVLRFRTINQWSGLFQTIIGLMPNTKYTFKCRLELIETSPLGAVGVYITNVTPSVMATFDYPTIGWAVKDVKVTFTTGSDTSGIELRAQQTSVQPMEMYITDIQVNEGENNNAWSPHAEELKTTDIEIKPGKMTVTNGAIEVKNGNNTVVIDGQHNMHKIMVTGTATINYSGNDTTFTITHNLGYRPSFSAYQQGAGGSAEFTPLPALTFGAGGLSAIIRARCDANKLYIDLLKTSVAPVTPATIYIKYFLYLEVAF